MFKEDDEKEKDVIVSDNDNSKGNPYHKPAGSPDGGEFTSGPESGNGEQPESEEDPDLALLAELGLTEEDLKDLADELEDLNQVSSIPLLGSMREVENNIEKFFSKRVVNQLDSLVGANPNASPYQFESPTHRGVYLNIYTCVFGKYRYQDNNAHYISSSEYSRMASDPNFVRVFRGISSTGERRKNILDSYTSFDVDNLSIYGNGMYGTNVYTTTDISYARSYGTPIYGLVDKNANYIDSDDLSRAVQGYDFSAMEDRTVAHLKTMGLSDERAGQIAHYFVRALRNDISLAAIMLGYDYQISDYHQRNILNLSKWYIRKEY